MPNLHFLGGAGTVTGSKFLLDTGHQKVLIDCGMFQGLKDLRLLNRLVLPIDVQKLDAVILTHAHLDHCGALPLLYKQGFKGPIFCTEPTGRLADVILHDAAHIQEEDAERANRMGYTKHKPAEPLFCIRDVEALLPQLKNVHLHEWQTLDPEYQKSLRFRFQPSGHILGSAFIEIEVNQKRIVFSGDVGRSKPLTFFPPALLHRADYLIIESTYGDRKHTAEDPYQQISKIVCETYARGGQLLIPSFAVGRTQDLLMIFSHLKKNKMIPDLPIYLDSPMAKRATQIFDGFDNWHRLGKTDLLEMGHGLTVINDFAHSTQIQKSTSPCIILAGSGMMTGGRILSHAFHKISNPKNTIALVGFQAAGTLGRFLKEGADEIKIFGQYVPVHAKIEDIGCFSAHADQTELLQWMKGFDEAPKQTFIVHGEPHASNALRVKIQDTLGWTATTPAMGSQHEIK